LIHVTLSCLLTEVVFCAVDWLVPPSSASMSFPSPSLSHPAPSHPSPPPPPSYVTTPGGVVVSRRELILLLSSTLRSLGCDGTVAALRAETGVSGRHQRVERMLELIREGRWKEARKKVDRLTIPSLSSLDRLRLHLVLLTASFIEMVEAALIQQAMPISALHCLQQHIAPLHRRIELHEKRQPRAGDSSLALSQSPSHTPSSSSSVKPSNPSPSSPLFSWSSVCSAVLTGDVSACDVSGVASLLDRLSLFFLFTDVQSLYEETGWDGCGGRSRQALAEMIADWLPRRSAVPPHRWMELIDLALGAAPSHSSTTLYPQLVAPSHRNEPPPHTHPHHRPPRVHASSPPVTSLFHPHQHSAVSVNSTQRR
jgi:hypothetical protein